MKKIVEKFIVRTLIAVIALLIFFIVFFEVQINELWKDSCAKTCYVNYLSGQTTEINGIEYSFGECYEWCVK